MSCMSWMALCVLVSRFVWRCGAAAWREGTALGLSTAVLTVLIVLGQLVHGDVDLTAEKRHTLAAGTTELLEELQDDVIVTCYLTENSARVEAPRDRGESLLQRMSRAMTEVDVPVRGFVRHRRSADHWPKRASLFERGLKFSRIAFEENGKQSFQTIWPGAMISYRGEEQAVQFLEATSRRQMRP